MFISELHAWHNSSFDSANRAPEGSAAETTNVLWTRDCRIANWSQEDITHLHRWNYGISFLVTKQMHKLQKELKITPILDKLLEYKRSCIQHVNRMPRNRLPRVMKHYCPTGRRNHGRPLKRLLDMWDRNGSTSGPTAWHIWWWWWWFNYAFVN